MSVAETGGVAKSSFLDYFKNLSSASPETLKKVACKASCLVLGALFNVRIARTRPMIIAAPLIVATTTLSAMGFFYPEKIINNLEKLFPKANQAEKIA